MPKVVLIGGAPLVGKSTVARHLAARLGYGCISTDDLAQAIRAVTTADSHSGLHVMEGSDYREYYASRTAGQLIADAERYHDALWPAVREVIVAHADWGAPTVIEGWALRPDKVAEAAVRGAAAVWLVAEAGVLESRLTAESAFAQGAADAARMVRHFVERSLWHNELIAAEAARRGLAVVGVSRATSPADICEQCLRMIGAASQRPLRSAGAASRRCE